MILGIEDQTGSIERRKLADLLILNDDPLQDIRATIDIDAVVLGGIVRDGSTLERRVPADLEPSRSETEHPQPEDTAHE
jgi:predicted amidohydrolase YtcJ